MQWDEALPSGRCPCCAAKQPSAEQAARCLSPTVPPSSYRKCRASSECHHGHTASFPLAKGWKKSQNVTNTFQLPPTSHFPFAAHTGANCISNTLTVNPPVSFLRDLLDNSSNKLRTHLIQMTPCSDGQHDCYWARQQKCLLWHLSRPFSFFRAYKLNLGSL